VGPPGKTGRTASDAQNRLYRCAERDLVTVSGLLCLPIRACRRDLGNRRIPSCTSCVDESVDRTRAGRHRLPPRISGAASPRIAAYLDTRNLARLVQGRRAHRRRVLSDGGPYGPGAPVGAVVAAAYEPCAVALLSLAMVGTSLWRIASRSRRTSFADA